MIAFVYVFMGLMLVSLLPALYAVTHGMALFPQPQVQRRAAIAIVSFGGGFWQAR
jgi:hypothetical protein